MTLDTNLLNRGNEVIVSGDNSEASKKRLCYCHTLQWTNTLTFRTLIPRWKIRCKHTYVISSATVSAKLIPSLPLAFAIDDIASSV